MSSVDLEARAPEPRDGNVTTTPSATVHVLSSRADQSPCNGRGPTSLDEVAWTPAYDRESVEQFFRAFMVARVRMQEAIDAARARRRVAQERAASRGSHAEITELIASAQGELDRLEREHREAIQTLKQAAAEEATRIVEVAIEEAHALRTAAARLAASARHPVT